MGLWPASTHYTVRRGRGGRSRSVGQGQLEWGRVRGSGQQGVGHQYHQAGGEGERGATNCRNCLLSTELGMILRTTVIMKMRLFAMRDRKCICCGRASFSGNRRHRRQKHEMTQHTYLEPGGRDAIGPACANDAAASHLPGGAVSSAAAAAALDSGVRVVHGEGVRVVS